MHLAASILQSPDSVQMNIHRMVPLSFSVTTAPPLGATVRRLSLTVYGLVLRDFSPAHVSVLIRRVAARRIEAVSFPRRLTERLLS